MNNKHIDKVYEYFNENFPKGNGSRGRVMVMLALMDLAAKEAWKAGWKASEKNEAKEMQIEYDSIAEEKGYKRGLSDAEIYPCMGDDKRK